MRTAAIRIALTALAMSTAVLVATAQAPPHPGRFEGPGGVGGPGPGSFEFGGLVGGFGGKVTTGKPFQATFTITRTEVLPDNSITNATSGTIARDADGDTYRDVKFPAIGPWATSGPQEFVYLRDVKALMQYIVNKTKGTYQAFAIREHHPLGDGGPGREHRKGPEHDSNNVVVSDNSTATYTDPATGTKYTVDDKKITRTIPAGEIGNANPIVIVSERWYSADLDLVLETSHSDPRFGTSVYQLSSIGSPTVSFALDPSWQKVEGRRFEHREFHKGGNPPPPPQP
jgi:hypothetical protein